MCSTESTILFRFHSVRMSLLVLCHVVITLFAFCACQCNFRAHNFHLHNFIVCFSDALFLGIKKRPTSKLFYDITLLCKRQLFFQYRKAFNIGKASAAAKGFPVILHFSVLLYGYFILMLFCSYVNRFLVFFPLKKDIL